MDGASDLLNLIAAEEVRVDLKFCDESGAARFHIPVACDLRRIRLIRHRVENRLIRQARWKLLPTGRGDEGEFLRPDGAIQRDRPLPRTETLKEVLASLQNCIFRVDAC
jgi:hypothetical protein